LKEIKASCTFAQSNARRFSLIFCENLNFNLICKDLRKRSFQWLKETFVETNKFCFFNAHHFNPSLTYTL
jgi:hypothetical protein